MRLSNRVKTILKICVTIALLGYILLANDVPLVFKYLTAISPFIWIVIFIFFAVSILITVIRTSLLLPGYTKRTLLYIRIVSSAYGFILPGQLAVEGLRAYLLGKGENAYSKPGAAIVVDKIVSLLALLVTGLIGLILTNKISKSYVIAFCAIGITLILFLFSFNFSFVRKRADDLLLLLSRKNGKPGKVTTFFTQLLDYWQGYASNKILLLKSFMYGILFHLIAVFIGILLTYGVGAGLNAIDWLWINATVSIALLLPITLGGLGIREAGMIGMLGLIGIKSEQALAVSFGFLSLLLIQAVVGFGIEIVITLKRAKTPEDNVDNGKK